MNLEIDGTQVRVGEHLWKAPHEVLDAEVVGNKVLLVYRTPAWHPRWEQFPNLEAFSLEGCRLWSAEHPTSQATDSYYAIRSTSPLVVLSGASYACTLDIESGRLLSSELFK